MKTVNPSLSVLESLEARLAPAGLVTLSLSTAGALTISGDANHNDFQITENGDLWTISAIYDDPGNNTTFRLNGGPEETSITFDAALSVKALLGAGDDEMILDGTLIPKTLNVNTGDGNDILELISTGIGSTTTVVMGNGDDEFYANGDLYFAKGMNVNLGKGENFFAVTADTFVSDSNVLATAGGSIFEQQTFLFQTGVGEVNGTLTLRTTTGSPTDFEIGASATDELFVTKAMTLQSAAGADSVTLRGDLDVGGLFAMRLGNGNNQVITTNLDQLGATGLTYTGGTGDDDLFLESRIAIIDGNFTFSAGAGTNILELNPSEYLEINRALTYTGGTGDDTLIVDGPGYDADDLPGVYVYGIVTMKASNGYNVMAINAGSADLGGVRYTGGSGTDRVDIGEFEGSSELIEVYGAVTINTGTGAADVQVRNAYIDGNLSVTTSAALGLTDIIYLQNSDFLGSVSLNMRGQANSDVIVDDSIFDYNVTINTGNGQDLVLFDNTVTDAGVARYSEFYGYVRINLGAHNDVFIAGRDPSTTNVGNDFYNYIDVNGGTGYDTAHFMDSERFNNGFNPPDGVDPWDLPWTYSVENYA